MSEWLDSDIKGLRNIIGEGLLKATQVNNRGKNMN